MRRRGRHQCRRGRSPAACAVPAVATPLENSKARLNALGRRALPCWARRQPVTCSREPCCCCCCWGHISSIHSAPRGCCRAPAARHVNHARADSACFSVVQSVACSTPARTLQPLLLGVIRVAAAAATATQTYRHISCRAGLGRRTRRDAPHRQLQAPCPDGHDD